MKRCPKCASIYTDDTLNYCLQDGAALALMSASQEGSTRPEPPPTEILDARAVATERLPVAVPTIPSALPPLTTRVKDERLSGTFLIPIVTVGLLLAVAIVAGVGLRFFYRAGNQAGAPQTKNNSTAGPDRTTSTQASQSDSNATSEKRPLAIAATASSNRPPFRGIPYTAQNAVDGRLDTAWLEGASGPGVGEWIQITFDREVKVRRMTIAPGYFKNAKIWARNNRLAAARITFSDGSFKDLRFPDRMEKQVVDLPETKTNFVKVQISEVYNGTDPDTAISEISFDWLEP